MLGSPIKSFMKPSQNFIFIHRCFKSFIITQDIIHLWYLCFVQPVKSQYTVEELPTFVAYRENSLKFI